MIQFAVGGSLKGLLHSDKTKPMTKSQEMGAGLGAGMVSAMWGTPLELIMIQQQRKGGSTPSTIKSMISGSHLGRGFVGCAIREGLWCVGYMSIPPIIRRELRQAKPDVFDSDDKARIPASLLGGAFACYLTQPVDTIKTCMQGDVERKTYKSFVDTGKVRIKQGVDGREREEEEGESIPFFLFRLFPVFTCQRPNEFLPVCRLFSMR